MNIWKSTSSYIVLITNLTKPSKEFFSDSVIFLYLGIAMVNYQMYQWDAVFIAVTFLLCLFVRQDADEDGDHDDDEN